MRVMTAWRTEDGAVVESRGDMSIVGIKGGDLLVIMMDDLG